MGLHTVGNPRDYGGDDNPPEHGSDTAIYQELEDVRNKYAKWFYDNKKDISNPEMEVKARQIADLLQDISDELNQPL